MPMNARLLRPTASWFSPRQIGGLELWFDATDLSGMAQNSDGTTAAAATNDPVGYWRDKSGKGRHARQGISNNNRPTLQLADKNGKPGLNFDGSNDFMLCDSGEAFAASFAFAVLRRTGTPVDYSAVYSHNPTSNVAGVSPSAQSFAVGQPGFSVGRLYGLQGSAGLIRLNGLSVTPVNSNFFNLFAALLLPNTTDTNIIGVQGNINSTVGTQHPLIGLDPFAANRVYPMRLYELLIYSAIPTTAQLQVIEGYLAWKWGLQAQLPYDHPYVNGFPGFSDMPLDVNYLVVAGGGGGGTSRGGGGGAGGVLQGTAFAATAGSNYTVTVGGGGAGATANTGVSGSNSVFSSNSASGGGGGGSFFTSGVSGGSGGGGGASTTIRPGGSGTTGQGNKGGDNNTSFAFSSAGGGGAGAAGANVTTAQATDGGIGILSSITGTPTYYAGGGGGSGGDGSTTFAGSGGLGGGGAGTDFAQTTGTGTPGTANTGGGGGGAAQPGGFSVPGGAGGSGVVILRYPRRYTPTISSSLTYDTNDIGPWRVLRFTAGSGHIAWNAPVVSNADAQDWVNRVYANGGSVSTSTATAVNDFCNAIDAAGIRDRFYRLNLFAGNSDASLNAVRTPLYRGPTYSPDGLGPELWSLSAPSIVNDQGSNGAWNGATSTFSNIGTGAGASTPRFRFSLPITVGKRYRVSGVLTGDIAAMAWIPIRLAIGGFTIIPYNSTTGVFSGDMIAAATLLEFLMDGTQGSKSVTIASVSVREVLTYGNATDTNLNFVAGDYAESSGLQGNGSNKALNTGFPANTIAAASRHTGFGLLATSSSESSAGNRFLSSNWSGGSNSLAVKARSFTAGDRSAIFSRFGTASDTFGDDVGAGALAAGNIVASWPTMYRNGVATGTASTTSQDYPSAHETPVFCQFQSTGYTNPQSVFGGRMGWYSFGEVFTATQVQDFDAALVAFYAAIGRS